MSLDEVRSVIEAAAFGSLATCVDGQPRVRPMAFVMLDDGRLWSSTWACSGKVAELRGNDRVEVSFVSPDRVQVRVEGVLDMTGGPEAKERLLAINPKVRRHFRGGDDPNFVHLEVRPTRIRWKTSGFCEYVEVPL